jgi:hypothetical protein
MQEQHPNFPAPPSADAMRKDDNVHDVLHLSPKTNLPLRFLASPNPHDN